MDSRIDRRTKLCARRFSSDWVRSSWGSTTLSFSRADGPYMSISELQPACDYRHDHTRTYRVLRRGPYAVRSYFSSHGRALVLNFTRWVFREDLRRGVPACLACGRCPRRINSNYCGSSCERWAMERQRSNQQHYTPMTPQAPVPTPGNFNWGSMAGGLPAGSNPATGYQPYQGPPNPPVGGT
jgi:hypothetical protein